MDFNRMVEFHRARHALVTLLTHPNSHPYDSGLLITENGEDYEQTVTVGSLAEFAERCIVSES